MYCPVSLPRPSGLTNQRIGLTRLSLARQKKNRPYSDPPHLEKGVRSRCLPFVHFALDGPTLRHASSKPPTKATGMPIQATML